jgi:hypothetical protein
LAKKPNSKFGKEVNFEGFQLPEVRGEKKGKNRQIFVYLVFIVVAKNIEGWLRFVIYF